MKLSSWRVEYTITLLIIFAAVLMFIPTSLQSTVQANLITKWKDCFDKLSYTQDVILKHEKENILTSFKRAKNSEEREEIFRQLLKPYFRLNVPKAKIIRRYHPKFLNNTKVAKDNRYYFADLYFSDKNMLVGIKDIPDSGNNESKFLMMFDVNGILPPNTWGKDIFGVAVYPDRVEPLGVNLDLPKMKDDCSANGTGVSCSNYYKIGGNFED